MSQTVSLFNIIQTDYVLTFNNACCNVIIPTVENMRWHLDTTQFHPFLLGKNLHVMGCTERATCM